MLFHQPSQVLFGFSVCCLREEERYVVCMSFENTPHPLTKHGSNQNVGIQNKGTALHTNYFDCRFFSRLFRRISLYSCMSSSSDAPHSAIIESSSLAAARIAST